MPRTPHSTNDGSLSPPQLRVYLNMDNLVDLRPDTVWPGAVGQEAYERLKADGFEGVQLTAESPVFPISLPFCGLGRINTPDQAAVLAARHQDRGDQCLTVHVGWGIEDDSEVSRLVEAVLAASAKQSIPIFIETHRATITQDLWRTVEITKRFPEVRFNGDFSHYYCGQELVYGDWEAKLAFMEPIFERVAFLHGRIASPGWIQAVVDREKPALYVEHFKQLWTRAMVGFLRHASPGDYLIFAPELLSSTHFYARRFPNMQGELMEESDRYAQALLYKGLAQECFAAAKASLGSAG